MVLHYTAWRLNKLILCLCLSIQVILCNAQLDSNNYELKPTSLLFPSAGITYGIVKLHNENLQKFDIKIRDKIKYTNTKNRIDDIIVIAPALSVYGLNLIGVKSKHKPLRAASYMAGSYILSQAIVQSMKYSTDVLRPDNSTYNSFPSSHTAVAFVGAECLYQEYKHRSIWYGIGGYAVAGSVAYLRMYNNRHWLGDVLTGAGIGILSTKLNYWLQPKLQKKFKK